MLKAAIPLLHVGAATAARDFYTAKLGFAVLSEYRADPGRADPSYLVIQRDESILHLSSFPGDGVAGHVVTLRTDDVDALHREFAATGVPIALRPTDQTWGNREMYVVDPDGNTLRFQQ